ncbi:MAG: hypothetical protein EA382_12550 [Spirochaetaceae bacterium]|nr:MAG: hypothetical protein EA382_12550 [Spirochaetaceae bacterium]
MLRRTFRLVITIIVPCVLLVGLATGGVFWARAVARRLIDDAAERAGVSVEYRRLRLSVVHGIVLSDATVSGAALPVSGEPVRVRVDARRVRANRRRLRVDDASVAVLSSVADGYGAPRTLRLERPVTIGSVRALFDAPVARGRTPAIATVDADRVSIGLDFLPASGDATTPSDDPESIAGTGQARDPIAAAGEIESALWRIVDSLAPMLPAQTTVTRGLITLAEPGGDDAFGVAVDSVSVRVDRLDDEESGARSIVVDADGSMTFGSAGRWRVSADLDPGSRRIEADIEFDSIDVSAVSLLVPAVSDRIGGVASAAIAFERSAATRRATLAGTASITDAVLLLPAVTDAPIRVPSVSYEFSARADELAPLRPARLARRIPGTTGPAPPGAGAFDDASLAGEIVVDSGHLRVGDVGIHVTPALRGFRDGAPARVDLRLSMPRTSIASIADAVPAEILGPIAPIRADGELSWDLDLEAPLGSLSWIGWVATASLTAFEIVDAPPALDVRSLDGAFLFRIAEVDGRDRVVAIPAHRGGRLPGERGIESTPSIGWSTVPGGAGTPAPLLGMPSSAEPDPSYVFAPLHSIAPWLISAVITAEDGEFYRHDGVNWMQAKSALERNLAAGDVVVGASTIQMQLAKNLFLDHERLASRKLQEVVLVALMRFGAELSRERAMELYLNIIEFGPGIYGIDHAARYYFGKPPSRLSLAESVWLASIIPSPQRFHAHFENRAIPPLWLRHMRSIMDLMVERGRITVEQYEAGAAEVPAFRAHGG